MQARDIVSHRSGSDELGLDLVERQWRGVDDAGVLWAKLKQRARHDRARIEADRTAGDQLAPAHGDEVGGAGTRADEMHGHGALSEMASAQVALPTTQRDAMRRDDGPAAASAAASASDGTPVR